MRSKTFIERVIYNPIIQTLIIFISGGWIILEITEYFIENFGLNEAARNILLIVLVSILPVAVFFAWYLNRKQKENGSPSSSQVSTIGIKTISLKSRRIIFPGTLLIIAIGVTFGFRKMNKSRIDRVLDNVLPELVEQVKYMSLSEGEENWTVYYKANDLRKVLRVNPDFIKLWDDITVPVTIISEPKGAKVYAKPYSLPDAAWDYLGETPLLKFHFPKGLSRLKIEKPGFDDEYDILFNAIGDHNKVEPRQYLLYRPDEKPAGMEHAKGYRADWNNTGTLPALNAGDFWIDKYEVTNEQYKVFIDSGGYSNPDYWKFPFFFGEDIQEWEIAIERFKDKTSLYGPANWIMGEFPAGEENYPVTGVSWYEAAAYASFSNKELPTIFHWTFLTELQAAPEIVKFGNFNKKGTVNVGTYQGMTRYGTYDLPGNVSEWVFNSDGNEKMIIGGNFQEPSYFYNYGLTTSPWTRNDRIGFRCMRYINDTLKNELSQSFNRTNRDFSKANPVTDEVFAVIRELYRYEKGGLNSRVNSTIDTLEWNQETVLVDVPYENTPMQIYVFLPKSSIPPFQTVIYYPHIGSLYSSSLDDMIQQYQLLEFYLKSGRAVIWPIYYETHGRGKIQTQDIQTWRQTKLYQVIDFQLTCDYLNSRNDIDTSKMAYFGVSWGGFMAPYILAIEDRIKLGILAGCGVHSEGNYKELDQINYLPRVNIPMLLMNGRYDFDFTMNKQQAFYDFLGTPEDDKVWIKYEHTHGAPKIDMINESLRWLDKYFGPVIE